MLELALFSPVFFFFFVGALDWGFLANALISMENATRTAVLYTSGGTGTVADATGACTQALGEMRKLPNVGTSLNTCSGSPLKVTADSVSGPDSAAASKVTVTYTTVGLIPIPGLLPRQSTITRVLTMRIRG
jgi:Flp pilus assembly protein TadG